MPYKGYPLSNLLTLKKGLEFSFPKEVQAFLLYLN
jgi:hypothetical protein